MSAWWRRDKQVRDRQVQSKVSSLSTGPGTAPGDYSVAVGGDNLGIVSTGPGSTNVQYTGANPVVLPEAAFIPVEKVIAPDGVMNVPALRHGFVGRATTLDVLDTAFAAAPPPSPSSPSSSGSSGARAVLVQAVAGLGGIGKSALAAHWAATRATGSIDPATGRTAPIWWVNAETPDSIETGLANLMIAIQPGLARAPLEVLVARAVQWLGAHTGWLLVLDNVTGPAYIQDLLPRLNPGGKVLITSRRSTGWHHLIAQPVRLDVLDPDEALAMIWQILHPQTPSPAGTATIPSSTSDETGAAAEVAGLQALCEELGCLPLALEQAAAHIAQTGITPIAYLELLATYPAEMYRDGGEDTPTERTLARIWHVTLDRLNDTPLCGDILRILAWYAPQDIPSHHLDALAPPPDVHRAIGGLAAYSMITIQTPDTLSVHRLVQALARTPEAHDPHRDAQAISRAHTYAATALINATPSDWRNLAGWPIWRSLLPHIDTLTTHTRSDTSPDDLTLAIAHLQTSAGLFLIDQGASARAVSYLQQALTDRRRILGDNHRDTLTAINNLAGAHQTGGDLPRAILLFEKVVTGCRRVLGHDHPDTFAAVNNLAITYQAAGDLTRPIPLLERTLSDRRRILGNDHRDTLLSLSNLAYAYQTAGDLGRAIPLYQQALNDRRRILGDDHPDTLSSISYLGYAYQLNGNLAQAIPLFERALNDRRRILGDDHPHTLGSINNLAYLYESAGGLAQAIPLYEQAVTACCRVLGNDHPDTLVSASNLATAYLAAEDLDRAIPLLEQTLTNRRRVLGNDHPHTLSSINDLAHAHRAAGDLTRAIPLYEQAYNGCLRALGPEHPMTGIARDNFGVAQAANS